MGVCVGRLSWVPAKMVEEEVAFPSLPALLLPGKQGTWRLWLSSPTVRTQTHKQSDTHSGENTTWVYSDGFLPIWVPSEGQWGWGCRTFGF